MLEVRDRPALDEVCVQQFLTNNHLDISLLRENMEIKLENMSKWDARFFDLCGLVGSWSEDRSRRVGAVIVGPANEVRSLGFNGLPRRISTEDDERHNRADGEKYYWFEHAERN